MRLSDLHPSFHEAGQDANETYLYFDCPHCGAAHRFQIPLQIGAGRNHGEASRIGLRWGWNGERDFEKVTVTPSIQLEGHWHGHITNGEIVA